MFFEDDLPKKKKDQEPRNLETLSVHELEEHIVWLESEITRCRDEIKRKKAASAAADGFFKK